MCSQRYKLPIRTRPTGLRNDLQSEKKEKKEQWQILALAFRKNHNALNPLEQTECGKQRERDTEKKSEEGSRKCKGG